jgi:ATP-dependent Lon protease
VSKIGRKAVKQLLLEKKKKRDRHDDSKNLDKYLGVRASATARRRRATASARSRAWRGPKWAASC